MGACVLEVVSCGCRVGTSRMNQTRTVAFSIPPSEFDSNEEGKSDMGDSSDVDPGL